jgi:hypothetical protein
MPTSLTVKIDSKMTLECERKTHRVQFTDICLHMQMLGVLRTYVLRILCLLHI